MKSNLDEQGFFLQLLEERMEVDILCTRIDNGRGRCWRIYNCIETVTIILFELSVGTET